MRANRRRGNWPRESTREDLTEERALSSPTVHQHLRTGERKFLRGVFEGDPGAE